jgi:hypothetical protein
MKTVIAVRGVGNTGKSSTIKMVYKLLVDKYPRREVEFEKITKREIRAILIVHRLKIGMDSSGDPSHELDVRLNLLVKLDCYVIICAARSSGATVHAVEALGQSGYSIWWQDRTHELESQHEASILGMAERIVARVAEIIAADGLS